MSDVAVNCTTDITNKVKLLPEFTADGKAMDVRSEDDLLDRAKLMTPPFCGVMYEGLRESGTDPSRQGLGCDLYVAVVVALAAKTVGNFNAYPEAARIVDTIRKQIRGTNSPTGHKWRFVMESYAGVIDKAVIYVQRWRTFTPIT